MEIIRVSPTFASGLVASAVGLPPLRGYLVVGFTLFANRGGSVWPVVAHAVVNMPTVPASVFARAT